MKQKAQDLLAALRVLSPVAKAIVGALVASLTALGTALADQSVTGTEIVAVILAGLVSLYAIWRTPNRG